MEILSIIVAVAAVLVSAGMGLYLFVLGKRQKDMDDVFKKLIDQGERLAKLEARAETQSPFFTALQSKLIDALHHPDPGHEEMDELLEKLKALTLNRDERGRLHDLLRARTCAIGISASERRHARTLLAVMPLVVEETRTNPEAGQREAAIPVHPSDTADNPALTLPAVIDGDNVVVVLSAASAVVEPAVLTLPAELEGNGVKVEILPSTTNGARGA